MSKFQVNLLSEDVEWGFWLRCDGVKKVLTMHQENIVRLPCCPDSDLCDYEKINEFYSESIESCDFDAMCNDSHSDSDSD